MAPARDGLIAESAKDSLAKIQKTTSTSPVKTTDTTSPLPALESAETKEGKKGPIPTKQPDAPEMRVYYAYILEMINTNWQPPSGDGQEASRLAALVAFTIGPDGGLSNLVLTESSGRADFDDSLLAAIKKSAPLPPLPSGFDAKPTDASFLFTWPNMTAAQKKSAAAQPGGSTAPSVAARDLKFDQQKVRMKLEIKAPGGVVEGLRLDNVGGRSALWRSDGRQKEAGLITVRHKGVRLTDGARPIKAAIPPAGLELEIELEDDGAFAGGQTDFRITIFLNDGKRISGLLKASEGL